MLVFHGSNAVQHIDTNMAAEHHQLLFLFFFSLWSWIEILTTCFRRLHLIAVCSPGRSVSSSFHLVPSGRSYLGMPSIVIFFHTVEFFSKPQIVFLWTQEVDITTRHNKNESYHLVLFVWEVPSECSPLYIYVNKYICIYMYLFLYSLYVFITYLYICIYKRSQTVALY